MHVVWVKEVHSDSLPFMKAVVIEAVCAVEACLSVAERTMKLHEFALLPDCIARWGECCGACFFSDLAWLCVTTGCAEPQGVGVGLWDQQARKCHALPVQ